MARFVLSTPTLSQPVGAQFLRLSERLAEDGHDVVVLVFREGGGSTRADIAQSFSGHTVMPWPSNEPTRLADGAFLFSLIRRFRPHCVVGQMESTNWTMVLSWLLRVPVRVAWYHMLMSAVLIDGARRSLPLRVRRRALVYRCATRLISVSHAGVDDLAKQYGVDPAKCAVVPNGLARTSTNSADGASPCPDGVVRLVTVGRLVPTKDHATLLRAFARVNRSVKSVLTIVGDGPQRSELESLAADLGIGDAVRFEGDVDHDRALDLMRGADMYVHSALSDNNPLAVIEAMSFGLPIVATAVGGVPEMISGGRDGVLVPPGDVPAMSSAIITLQSDVDRSRSMGAAARQRFLDEYEVSHWVDRTRALLLAEIERAS